MKRSAFTLVELLVIIAIIAILVALLIPAVSAAREHARRNQCLTQQRSLAMAMITYDKDNNGLPGYLNELGRTPVHSWAVAIFPMIGENKRYEAFMEGGTVPSEALESPLVLLCPSSDRPGRNTPQLHYVVNCGPTESVIANTDVAIALTLFRDRRSSIPGASTPSDPDLRTINKRAKIEDIPDGASNTILLSENVGAGLWYQEDNWAIPGTTADFTNTRDRLAVLELGFIWENSAVFAPNSSPPPSSPRLPRPSSKHPGAVVAAFADGSARSINDNIAILDWLRFVCPDDKKAGF